MVNDNGKNEQKKVEMTRAGVANHPKEWINRGYNAIKNPKQRNNRIDLKRLPILDSLRECQKHHQRWIDAALKNDCLERDSQWSESIAVGRKSFVE